MSSRWTGYLPARGPSSQARTSNKQTTLQRPHREVTDLQIDALVYELYALTKEEIGIVVGWG